MHRIIANERKRKLNNTIAMFFYYLVQSSLTQKNFQYDAGRMNSTDGNSNTQYSTGKSDCVGTYPVSGYTRADGVVVDDYMRTCGAAHISKQPENAARKDSEHDAENDWNNVSLDDIDELLYKNLVQENYNAQSQLLIKGQIEKSNVGEEVRNFFKDNFKQYQNYEYLTMDEILQKMLAKFPKGDEFLPIKDYYKISLNLADNPDKVLSNDRYSVYKLDNLPFWVDEKLVYDKLARGMKVDLSKVENEAAVKNIRVVIPKNNSKIKKLIKDSEEIKQLLKHEDKNIEKGMYENKYFKNGIEFKCPIDQDINSKVWRDKATLFGVLHNVDVFGLKQYPDGTVTFTITDFYDFENWSLKENDSVTLKFIKYINNNAYRQQKYGKLVPYVIYIPIEFSLSEIYDILYPTQN